MPKKFKKNAYAKPASTAHHTLVSGGSRPKDHDRLRPSSTSSPAEQQEQPSVNELIDHLRRTQVTRTPDHGPESPYRFVVPRSVHPSLRNLLELPETPPPRPRPGSRRHAVVGARRGTRRTAAGPPAPQSWLVGNYGREEEDKELDEDGPTESRRTIYRLAERLPGTTFPARGSLQHTVLKAMALYWAWHLEYDGPFLADLPNHVKVRLLSFIGVYTRDYQIPSGLGLRVLFPRSQQQQQQQQQQQMDDDFAAVHKHSSEAGAAGAAQENDDEITRLDLSSALGRWLTLKQISSELLLTTKQSTPALQQTPNEPASASTSAVPSSWEDEYDEHQPPQPTTPTSLTTTTLRTPRFTNLRYLSLAHPTPASANWNSLITLLARLTRITHLSLAHWPLPTATPHARTATVRHPAHRSLTFAYGGTDAYAASDNNWAEVAGLLRRLSRATYCLKWLDLEGCGEWLPALNWVGRGPDGEVYPSGPEWNGSWREVEFIRLGAGWVPSLEGDDDPALLQQQLVPEGIRPATLVEGVGGARRALAASMHAPPPAGAGARGDDDDDDDDDDGNNLPWDVEEERIKYRRMKEVQRYREIVETAKEVQRNVQRVRKEGKGKWVTFSFGLEGLEDDALKRLLGPRWLDLLP